MDVVKAGTGQRCRIPEYDVFGKTGTTNEFMDAWFAGGVPGLVTVVYAGNDDHSTIGNKATGGVIAGPVWKDFMARAVVLLNLQKKFTVPPASGVQLVKICRDTGYLATSDCPGTDIYLPLENVPESYCPTHGGDTYLARIDPRAPRILLLPEDSELYSQYRKGYSGNRPMDQVAETRVIQGNKAPELPVEKVDPYKKDPSSPEEIEKRYQDLLKQYGITD